jgi:hypothetical protein
MTYSISRAGDLILTFLLVLGVVWLQPRAYRIQVAPFCLIATSTCAFLLLYPNRTLMLPGLVVALAAMGGAFLFRDWPRVEIASVFWLTAGIGVAISGGSYVAALLLATICGLALRFTWAHSSLR